MYDWRFIIKLAYMIMEVVSVMMWNAPNSAEKMSGKNSKYLSKMSLCPGLYCRINLPFLTWKCASTMSRGYSLDLGWGGREC